MPKQTMGRDGYIVPIPFSRMPGRNDETNFFRCDGVVAAADGGRLLLPSWVHKPLQWNRLRWSVDCDARYPLEPLRHLELVCSSDFEYLRAALFHTHDGFIHAGLCRRMWYGLRPSGSADFRSAGKRIGSEGRHTTGSRSEHEQKTDEIRCDDLCNATIIACRSSIRSSFPVQRTLDTGTLDDVQTAEHVRSGALLDSPTVAGSTDEGRESAVCRQSCRCLA